MSSTSVPMTVRTIFNPSSRKQIVTKPISISNNDFVDRLSLKNRAAIILTEAGKLLYLFQIASKNDTVSIIGLSFFYLVSSLLQASIIRGEKSKMNEEERFNGNYWLYKNEQPVAKIESTGNQIKKSLIPGRGLAFLKLPKFR
jgi:hypothetical protein